MRKLQAKIAKELYFKALANGENIQEFFPDYISAWSQTSDFFGSGIKRHVAVTISSEMKKKK